MNVHRFMAKSFIGRSFAMLFSPDATRKGRPCSRAVNAKSEYRYCGASTDGRLTHLPAIPPIAMFELESAVVLNKAIVACEAPPLAVSLPYGQTCDGFPHR
jgi:hypothetical protein